MHNDTDWQLLARAKIEYTLQPPPTGAFEAILLKYQRLIYYIANRYFSSKEDAQDASQEAALKIYNGLQRVDIEPEGSLKPWISTVITRTCIDFLRKNRIQTVELTDETGMKPATPSPTVEDIATNNERGEEILKALKALPHDTRMIIILRDIEGLSYEEVANAMELNIGTVKSRLSRARGQLKKLLEKNR